MEISINLENFSKEKREEILSLIGDEYTLPLSGKEKSEKLESRLRSAILEPRPDTTDYDFCYGEKYFFNQDRVELKQFYAYLRQPKIQQVKEYLYDKILVVAEFKDKTEWYILKTNQISKRAGKENKEEGKLVLQRQHKGNDLEGQIQFNKTFKKFAKLIGVTGNIDYKKTSLGLTDSEIIDILTLVKNH